MVSGLVRIVRRGLDGVAVGWRSGCIHGRIVGFLGVCKVGMVLGRNAGWRCE